MKEITIVFKYKEGDGWKKFWDEQITNRLAYANSEAAIQVTSWAIDENCIYKLTDIREILDK